MPRFIPIPFITDPYNERHSPENQPSSCRNILPVSVLEEVLELLQLSKRESVSQGQMSEVIVLFNKAMEFFKGFNEAFLNNDLSILKGFAIQSSKELSVEETKGLETRVVTKRHKVLVIIDAERPATFVLRLSLQNMLSAGRSQQEIKWAIWESILKPLN
jgi:predicted nucleic acid-binding protein